MSFASLLKDRLEGIVPVTLEMCLILQRHYELLLVWNRRLNLTTVTSLEEAVERHYAESLILAARIGSGRIGDIGSGAGFPGFPVAAFHPSSQVVLVESDQRKAAFLREASDLVRNVRVQCVRANRFAGPADWIVSRAVRAGDVLEVALRLQSRLAVLVGLAEKDQLLADRRLSAAEAVQLPWGESRWLVTAECFT
jgi:16S rRNA (guanine527-N7)-methyltransferase